MYSALWISCGMGNFQEILGICWPATKFISEVNKCNKLSVCCCLPKCKQPPVCAVVWLQIGMPLYIYIYVCVCMSVYIYIYIYGIDTHQRGSGLGAFLRERLFSTSSQIPCWVGGQSKTQEPGWWKSIPVQLMFTKGSRTAQGRWVLRPHYRDPSCCM